MQRAQLKDKLVVAAVLWTWAHEKFSRLPVNPLKTDLTLQEGITRLVQSVTPMYDTVTVRGERYADLIASMIGTSVSITSYGQTAADKKTRARRSHAA